MLVWNSPTYSLKQYCEQRVAYVLNVSLVYIFLTFDGVLFLWGPALGIFVDSTGLLWVLLFLDPWSATGEGSDGGGGDGGGGGGGGDGCSSPRSLAA